MRRRLLPLVACSLATFICYAPASVAQDAAAEDEGSGVKSVSQFVQEVRQLAVQGKLDEADALFAEAVKEYPDDLSINALRTILYSFLGRAGQHAKAAAHLDANLTFLLDHVDSVPPATLENASGMITYLPQAYESAGDKEAAAKVFERYLAKAEEVLGEKEKPSSGLVSMVARLRTKRAAELEAAGDKEQAAALLAGATKLIDDQVAAAKKEFEADESADKAVILAGLLRVKGALLEGEAAVKTRQELLEFLAAQTKQHPAAAALVNEYVNNAMTALQGMARSQPKQASELLASVRETLDALGGDNEIIQRQVSSAKARLASLERTIAAGLKHAELIGTDMPVIEAQAWVNGEPMKPEDFKGKVVLLDFWAVWCGPCIATFPHLREWQEKFERKGLVIVGVTNYYTYGWDETTKRPKKVDGLSPEAERDAMQKFAEHHGLKHRFAVMDNRDLSLAFGVTGIPQAVVIDQAGKVRLIKVGSGEPNAIEIEKLLAELMPE